jgi:hypothetical protein
MSKYHFPTRVVLYPDFFNSDGNVGWSGGKPTLRPANGSSSPIGGQYWYRPVTNAVRVAEHTAELAYACRKRTLFTASLSMFGVLISGRP